MKEPVAHHRFRLPRLQLRGSNGLGVAMLLGLFSALLFTPYIQYFESRDDPERISLKLPFALTLEGMEYWLFDSYFRDDESSQPKVRDKIAIIGVDNSSIMDIGAWPWPRSVHARLINRLHKAGAKVIALDFDFSEPGPLKKDGKFSDEDQKLIAAAAAAKNVVLPAAFETTHAAAAVLKGKGDSFTYDLLPPFSENNAGQEGLDEATPDVALNYQPQDSDGGFRRYSLLGKVAGADVGSYASLVSAVYQHLSLGDDQAIYETSLRRRQWFSLKNGMFDVPTREVAYEGRDAPSFSQFLLKYRYRGAFPIYSYRDVLDPVSYSDTRMKTVFKDKIVLVGATLPSLKDMFPAPGGQQVSGVELHAGAVCQLLEGSFIDFPEYRTTFLNLYGMALISALWPQLIRSRISRFSRRAQERWKARKFFKRWNLRIQDLIWFLLTGALAPLPAFCFLAICYYSFNHFQIWTVMAYPMLGSILSASLVTVYLFTLETAERRKVMRQVGLYLDPDIMETILAYPEEDYPRPRRTVATVMFTDLQGFTAYSESHSADDVVTALNAYMSRLQPIIKKHHGSVDKYIGDAIMAYFGVPVTTDDHATWALRCAIEIQEESCRFRQDTGIPFYTRVGIHTGELIAGSIGSQSSSGSLIAYTVIGDTVNLASRLEAKNKEFGSWILCSKATVDAAPGIARVEPVSASIRGKSQVVEMFVVRGPANSEPRDEIWGAPLPKTEEITGN